MAAQVKKGRRHTSFLTVLVIAILIALVGVQLIHLRTEIEAAQNQLTALKSDLDSAKQAPMILSFCRSLRAISSAMSRRARSPSMM